MNWMRPSLLRVIAAMTVMMVFSLAYFVIGAQQPAREQPSLLPPAPPPFRGVINLQADQSKPYWLPTVVPPKGAPNVLLIMTDDQGYSVLGPEQLPSEQPVGTTGKKP